jgi:hypothetical protein
MQKKPGGFDLLKSQANVRPDRHERFRASESARDRQRVLNRQRRLHIGLFWPEQGASAF